MLGRSIQPINFWQDGKIIAANTFYVQVVQDNTINFCKLEYFMQNVTYDAQNNPIIITLLRDNLTINGADYISYNTSPNGNDYIYTWCALPQNLNLIYI